MKKKSASQSAFFNLRVLIGLFIVLAGVFLALAGLGTFSATHCEHRAGAAEEGTIKIINILGLPPGFDCSTIHEMGIDKMENFTGGLIMIACGEAPRHSASASNVCLLGSLSKNCCHTLAPLAYGAADVNLITGYRRHFPNITQSETFTTANPDNPNQIVVAYNDSRGRKQLHQLSPAHQSPPTAARPSPASPTPGSKPLRQQLWRPVVLYNSPTGTWFTVWLDAAAAAGPRRLQVHQSVRTRLAGLISAFTTTAATTESLAGLDNNPASPFREPDVRFLERL